MNIDFNISNEMVSGFFFENNPKSPIDIEQSNKESPFKSDSLVLSKEAVDKKNKEKKSEDPGELTEKEEKEVDELKKRDSEVRRHEQAHLAAAAGLSASGPFYQYTTGPDGRKYATGGEVRIDNSPEKEPEDTIRKMQRVRAAALAPADPSPQDRSVATQASRTEAKARQELAKERSEEMNLGGKLESSSDRNERNNKEVDFDNLISAYTQQPAVGSTLDGSS